MLELFDFYLKSSMFKGLTDFPWNYSSILILRTI